MKLILAFVVSFSVNAWAKDGDSDALTEAQCEKLLGFTLETAGPDFQFKPEAGMGMRGFLGIYPAYTPENVSLAAAQGVAYWGHSFAVKKSTIAAAQHDAQFSGLNKIMYWISDVDVSDLSDDTDPAIVQARFRQVMATGQLIYFDDRGGQTVLREIPRRDFERLLIPETIDYFTLDDRGPRFGQNGWVFGKIRGVMTYQDVFESNSNTIRDVIKRSRNFERKGYTVTFNQDYRQALEKARDQVRIEKMEDGRLKAIGGGSRFMHEDVFATSLKCHELGICFSVEVRDPLGRLVAGFLGARYGNLLKFDTVFYDYMDREGTRYLTSKELTELADSRESKSLIDLAKMAVLAGLSRVHEAGIDMVDVGMVTVFTGSIKGKYIDGDEYLRHVRELRARPPAPIDFKTPYRFQ
ncbi:MAG: hypothetical protein AB7F86_03810 [Bdellovibrionales bacterium]